MLPKFFKIFMGWFVVVFLFQSVFADESGVTLKYKEVTTYPCSKCHSRFKSESNAEKPLQKDHQAIRMKHSSEMKNCTFCHSQANPNLLVLLEGDTVAFKDVHLLCSQCHGKRAREWERGVHGRQTGSWNGMKIRSSCSECHDPHAPHFRSMNALPNPSKSSSSKKGH